MDTTQWLHFHFSLSCTPFTVTTKKGNIICLSENSFKEILETMYLLSNPVMNKEILEGLATPEEECIKLEDVEW